ncbi:unnamed protein product [Cyberlindnera jadinii]|uniref:Uncharacterized protein n=1 Tax=Cyberlindnera jadinii (strain ATCC 18201 / CBS 1600 / BCRC 20928 / JCM 3617 / NBRC 0987 / NRRL Y-1542) TaxID=983966 RepID=A0A0H5C488_CYBJN|nr:unnamed protein product [Cyberlindnera jadinii]
MSNLVINTDSLKEHSRENHIVKVRILGMVLEYNALSGFIRVQPIINLTQGRTPLDIRLDQQLQLDNAELCYSGTMVDAMCIYDGDFVSALEIKVIRNDFTTSDRETLRAMSEIKNHPL